MKHEMFLVLAKGDWKQRTQPILQRD